MRQINVVFALALGFWLTQLSSAQTLPGNPTNFPMMGITRGQTLKINLVAYPPDPCDAALGFRDSSGNPVGPTTNVTLQPGQSVSLAIAGNSLATLPGERVEVLPTVVVSPGTSPEGCRASAEVLDDVLGVTTVLLPAVQGYLTNPEFSTLGVTAFETVRLNVVAFPPDPCVGQISFLNSDGELVGNALKNVNLQPGQAAFLDLPGSTLVTKLGQRAEVRPVISPTNNPAAAPNACVVSAEVYTNVLGTTTSYYPPDPCDTASTSCFTF
jgi:hypothetical protein